MLHGAECGCTRGVNGSLKCMKSVFRCGLCVQEKVVFGSAESMNDGKERGSSFGYLEDKLNTGYLRY